MCFIVPEIIIKCFLYKLIKLFYISELTKVTFSEVGIKEEYISRLI